VRLDTAREIRLVYWIVMLGSCAITTIVGTIWLKSPMVAAIGTSVLAGCVIAILATGAFWALATFIVIVCSLPVTVVTAIVTEDLMDKYAPGWKA
jgi:hypothetical protein